MLPTNRSIAMVDWSGKNEVTLSKRDQFAWHQMLYSLLYDEVLVGDENLLCSKKLPKWFGDSDSFRLFEEIVECGGLRVLKRPLERYPPDLQELAVRYPIGARREQLVRSSVDNDGVPLRFEEADRAFHGRLETLLLTRARAHREAGTRKPGADLSKAFGDLLVKVLSDRRYENWLRSKSRKIAHSTTEDFKEFVHDPSLAIKRLEENGTSEVISFPPGARFGTVLATQVAATYKADKKHLMGLILRVFASVYCDQEEADGQYSRVLRELPVGEEDGSGPFGVVRVERAVDVRFSLPWPRPGFANIIQAVREADCGKELRRAMKHVGDDTTFTAVTEAWKAGCGNHFQGGGR